MCAVSKIKKEGRKGVRAAVLFSFPHTPPSIPPSLLPSLPPSLPPFPQEDLVDWCKALSSYLGEPANPGDFQDTHGIDIDTLRWSRHGGGKEGGGESRQYAELSSSNT